MCFAVLLPSSLCRSARSWPRGAACSTLAGQLTFSRGGSVHPGGHPRPLPALAARSPGWRRSAPEALGSPGPGPAPCAAPGRAPRRAAPGAALPTPLAGNLLSSPIFFFLFNIFSFLRHFSSPSCRERRQGGGREKYCLNSQSGASGAPCAWHLCSLCPEQRARTGARGRRGSRASVGRHNKVTKQRRGAGPAALPSQRTRG